MQSFPRLLLTGFAGFALAAPVLAQRPDDQIQPRSIELMHQGQALMAAAPFAGRETVDVSELEAERHN